MQTHTPEKFLVLGVIGVPRMLGASNHGAFSDGTQERIDRNAGGNEHLLCSGVLSQKGRFGLLLPVKELIYQEVWGLLLAYNIIRREASQAAVAFGRSPSDIRFKPVAHYITVQLIVMAAANPISATGQRLSALRAGVGGLFLDHRPRPSRARTVKISKTRYPVDRKAAPLK